MKKFYILAALALMSVSCAKQVPVAQTGPESPISFSPLTNWTATKAPVYGEIPAAYNTSESFQAYAFFTKESSSTSGYNPQVLATTPDATKGSEFFPAAGVQCNYNSTYNAWEPVTAYYWPRAGYLHFQAISPASFTKTALTHSFAHGFTIDDFVAGAYTDANTAEELTADNTQIDLLYSNFVFDKQRSGYNPQSGVPYDDEDDSGVNPTYDGVDIIFNHALSAIKFKVKTQANYMTGTQQHRFIVRKIEILKAYNTGDFTENRSDDADNTFDAVADMTGKVGFVKTNADGSATAYWNDFKNEVASITPYDAMAGTGITASTTPSDPIGTQILALPQPLDHTSLYGNKVKVKVTFDYGFSNDSGSNWYDYPALTSELEIAGFHATSYNGSDEDYVVNNWLINHKYTYVLNFKLDPIIFDPKVEAFVEVDNIVVDLPAQN